MRPDRAIEEVSFSKELKLKLVELQGVSAPFCTDQLPKTVRFQNVYAILVLTSEPGEASVTENLLPDNISRLIEHMSIT